MRELSREFLFRAAIVMIVCFAAGWAGGSMLGGGYREATDLDAEILKDYLASHPGILLDNPELLSAAEALHLKRSLAKEADERRRLMAGKWSKVTHSPLSPVIGEPRGQDTIIEFTDYICVPCRKSAPAIDAAVRANRNLKVILLQFPVSGPRSELAARAAIAAYRQDPDLFYEFHSAMMQAAGGLDPGIIFEMARAAGLDAERLRESMGAREIISHIENIRSMAAELGIKGAPAFIVGDSLVWGGVTIEQLSQILKSGRG